MSETLREALVRTNAALHKALAGIPQRDVDEIIAHNEVLLEEAALSTAPTEAQAREPLWSIQQREALEKAGLAPTFREAIKRLRDQYQGMLDGKFEQSKGPLKGYAARLVLKLVIEELSQALAAPSVGEQAAEQREELTGRDLAGCADRAGVVLKVYERQRGYVMPRADDWNRFAKEVRALRGAGQ